MQTRDKGTLSSLGAEVQQATPLSDTRGLVSGSRIWWGGLKGVVGKDIALCEVNEQEKLTGTPRS